MTEPLDRFLARVNSDPSFRKRVSQDPSGALAEFELRPAQQVALASSDEDALRRLASIHVQDEALWWTRVKRFFSRLFCGPGGTRTRSWECPKQPSDPG